MSVITRPLQASDEMSWRALWKSYLAFYDTVVSEEIYETTFARLIDLQRPMQTCIVAEVNGELVGLVHVIYHAHNWRIEEVCYLQDLYVAPQARGEGVGRALIYAVYEMADANGTPSVYWLTQDINTQARTLYDRVAQLTPFIKYSR